jgi:hypothetical protein
VEVSDQPHALTVLFPGTKSPLPADTIIIIIDIFVNNFFLLYQYKIIVEQKVVQKFGTNNELNAGRGGRSAVDCRAIEEEEEK